MSNAKKRKKTAKKRKKTAKKRKKATKKRRVRSKSRVPKSKQSRRPRRRGYVNVVRHKERFRGQLLNRRGRLVPRGMKRMDRLLRSLRSRKSRKINRRLLKLLAKTSDHFGGRTMVVVSGYRPYSPKQFTPNSRHNHAAAVDFRIVGVPNRAVYTYCLHFSKVGCGYYPNSLFIHMDVRKHKTQWVDYSRPGEAPRYARGRRRKASKGHATRRKARPGHGSKGGAAEKLGHGEAPSPKTSAPKSGKPKQGKKASKKPPAKTAATSMPKKKSNRAKPLKTAKPPKKKIPPSPAKARKRKPKSTAKSR